MPVGEYVAQGRIEGLDLGLDLLFEQLAGVAGARVGVVGDILVRKVVAGVEEEGCETAIEGRGYLAWTVIHLNITSIASPSRLDNLGVEEQDNRINII